MAKLPLYQYFLPILAIILIASTCFAQESATATIGTGSVTTPLEDDSDFGGLQILRHNPIYFISGEPDTKVQFSFKVKLLKSFPIYMGYTQVMFWELNEESWPFYDVNYNPEFFYVWKVKKGILKEIDFGAYEHRSNGKDGPESRSWNRSYVNFNTEFKYANVDWRWDSKFFYFIKVEPGSKSVSNTMGSYDTALTARNIFKKIFKSADAQVRFLPGAKWDINDPHGYQEFNFRFKLDYEEFNPYIFLQVYNGMNETMLDYKSRRTSYRIGFEI